MNEVIKILSITVANSVLPDRVSN